MGSLSSSSLVTELQRRITNLDSTTALAALNRAYRWIMRQSSYQFLKAGPTTISVNAPTSTIFTTTKTGVAAMVSGSAVMTYVSGDHFDTTGAWGGLVGSPPAYSGSDGLPITIGGDSTTYKVYWVQDSTNMLVIPTYTGSTGNITWSLTITSTTSGGNGPSNMDPGKAKVVLNSDGTPVQHVPYSEFWESYNYNLPSFTSYDTYTIISDNSQNPPVHNFLFFPSHAGTVTLYYHKVLTDLTGAADYTVLPKDFDDVLVDIAEAEERRIYDVGDTWQLLLARSQDQLKVLIDGYKSQTEQPGPQAESVAKIQEETTSGRA